MIDSAGELIDTLAGRFGLDVPEVVELWPRIEARHRKIMQDQP